jgi:hypothetical protein
MLIDPKEDKPTRFGNQRNADGKLEGRLARRSKQTIGK